MPKSVASIFIVGCADWAQSHYLHFLFERLHILFECFKDTSGRVVCQFDMSMPDWLIAFGRGCGLHREELLNLAVCEAASVL